LGGSGFSRLAWHGAVLSDEGRPAGWPKAQQGTQAGQGIGLFDGLVQALAQDAREAHGDARLVARGQRDALETDLEHHARPTLRTGPNFSMVVLRMAWSTTAISASVRPE
jgi:hypothetical protein